MRKLISLGHACDVAFQIRMHTGDNTSHFFDWLATPAKGLIDVLERDFEVFHPDHLRLRHGDKQSFVEDTLTGVRFFHHFPTRQGRVYENYLVHYPEFIDKFHFLAKRFRETVQAMPVTLVRKGISATEAERLERVFFERFPAADVEFLYVVPPGKGFGTTRGKVVELPPRKTGFGDIVEWASLLKFLGLINQPFRLSTAEILAKNSHGYNFTHEKRHADPALLAACRQNPGNPWLQYELALNYIKQSKYEYAAEAIAAALKLSKGNVEFQRIALKVDAMRGKVAAGQLVPLLQQLFEEMPDNLNLRRDLLEALIETEHFTDALHRANELLALDPYHARSYFNKAKCLHRLGKHRLAELAIDSAIFTGPVTTQYHALKASILAATNRLQAAVSEQQKALSLGGGIAVMLRLGKYLHRSGRFKEAMEVLDAAAERDPDHPAVKNLRERAEQGLLKTHVETAAE